MAKYNSVNLVSWFLPCFLSYFWNDLLNRHQEFGRNSFSHQNLFVFLGLRADSRQISELDKSSVLSARSPVRADVLDKYWLGVSWEGPPPRPASPSPVCRSGHPAPGVWQHLRWDCGEETKSHIGPETLPTKEPKRLMQGTIYLACKLLLGLAASRRKKILLLCARVLQKSL